MIPGWRFRSALLSGGRATLARIAGGIPCGLVGGINASNDLHGGASLRGLDMVAEFAEFGEIVAAAQPLLVFEPVGHPLLMNAWKGCGIEGTEIKLCDAHHGLNGSRDDAGAATATGDAEHAFGIGDDSGGHAGEWALAG